MSDIYIPEKGISFSNAVIGCQKFLRLRSLTDITLEFNDIHIQVRVDSNRIDLEIIYNLKHLLRQHNIKY